MATAMRMPGLVTRHALSYAVAGVILGALDASVVPAAWSTLLVGAFLGAAQRVAVGRAVGPAWTGVSALAWAGGVLLDSILRSGTTGGSESAFVAQLGSWVVPMACTIAAQSILLGARRGTVVWIVTAVVAAAALQASVSGTCALVCTAVASTVGPDVLPVLLTTVGCLAFGLVAGVGWTMTSNVDQAAR